MPRPPKPLAERKTLPIEAWPDADRRAWQDALHDCEDVFSEGAAAGWSARRAHNVKEGYARFLGWVMRWEPELAVVSPPDRITPGVLDAYCAMLAAEMSSVSVAARVGALTAAMKAMHPDRDWRLLGRRFSRLKMRAEASRDKRAAVVGSLELYQLGLQLMDTAAELRTAWREAKQYQDGLMIALLAARPLRMRNFQDLRLGSSLLFDGRTYWLHFDHHQTKTGAAIDLP